MLHDDPRLRMEEESTRCAPVIELTWTLQTDTPAGSASITGDVYTVSLCLSVSYFLFERARRARRAADTRLLSCQSASFLKLCVVWSLEVSHHINAREHRERSSARPARSLKRAMTALGRGAVMTSDCLQGRKRMNKNAIAEQIARFRAPPSADDAAQPRPTARESFWWMNKGGDGQQAPAQATQSAPAQESQAAVQPPLQATASAEAVAQSEPVQTPASAAGSPAPPASAQGVAGGSAQAAAPQKKASAPSAPAGQSSGGDDAVFEAMERLAQAYPKLHKVRDLEFLSYDICESNMSQDLKNEARYWSIQNAFRALSTLSDPLVWLSAGSASY